MFPVFVFQHKTDPRASRDFRLHIGLVRKFSQHVSEFRQDFRPTFRLPPSAPDFRPAHWPWAPSSPALVGHMRVAPASSGSLRICQNKQGSRAQEDMPLPLRPLPGPAPSCVHRIAVCSNKLLGYGPLCARMCYSRNLMCCL